MAFIPTLLARACSLALLASSAVMAAEPARNVILFIPDGLRAGIVDAQTAPNLAQLRREGVNFQNSHSLFPTFTTPNASAMATGHYLGDTGDFGNTIYTGFPVPGASNSVTPFLENDEVLGDVDEHFAGNYLDEETLLAAARHAGLSTAAVGKLGPVAIQDVTARDGEKTVIVDDSTGHPTGIPLSAAMQDALKQAGLPLEAPSRGANGKAGNATTPGTLSANIEQQRYFLDVTNQVLLPRFKENGKPFVLVFWSRDPDGTQHNQGDSLGKVTPGINGPTSLAAIRNVDTNLGALRARLKELGLDGNTDIFVSADHGFSTISKESKTSPAAKASYPDVPKGLLPPGFLALDLATALELPLLDPDAKGAAVEMDKGQHPSKANGLIGPDPAKPEVVVAANGGSDLVYLPQGDAKALAPKVVAALLKQDYVSGLFVDDDLGKIPGTLPLSAINLKGSALTPYPAIVVNFRSYDSGCGKPDICAVEVADTGLQQGQGMHGSFSRGDTHNFMAAIGPDFRKGFVDLSPVSNADVGQTLAHLLHLEIPAKGQLVGRVIGESLEGGKPVKDSHQVQRSAPAAGGLVTELKTQNVGSTRYFDAAGFKGRSVGL
ncbi:alkaline phosphatase family protein [Pseudomonas sp. JBR1]|uniref:alkaline phosphatase family protein n=1 Tax=Pseudomonas sp. JBR1 TaxID=3020907 RepID=UPI002305A4C6|nr:nucleotide pyrophosphatase/phosphodiesterase family protein [Pseudomonas sp. JBR1]WCE06696.1 alkaline phosphatase family protein [Pseudomonas sp. JBR1]